MPDQCQRARPPAQNSLAGTASRAFQDRNVTFTLFAPEPAAHHLRNAKLQLSAVLAPGGEVPGLYLHPDHRRRLRRAPVRSDLSV
jgi:hypothetical protein